MVAPGSQEVCNMLCPDCKEDMLIIEYKNIELDYCNECSGIWLDEGELELLLKPDSDSSVMRVLMEDSRGYRKGNRRCPVCGKRMLLVDIPLNIDGKEMNVEIDKCPLNHGLWFDNGELQQILSLSNGEPVANFLVELFS